MKSVIYRSIEFLIIFILIPISFSIHYAGWIKMIIGSVGFLYIVYVLLKIEKLKFKVSSHLNWKPFWKQTFVKFIGIAIIATLFVWFTNKEVLFNVILEKPKLWIFILFIYIFFSVYPQELIYRTFYFQRYSKLFNNNSLFIFINAIVFSLAHIFFRNTLVIVLTFLGGLLFALTYSKTQSTLLVSIEHAVYGCWLFTVGMGEMLGFPA